MSLSRATPLPRTFYERPVLTVARDLIGKVLVHRGPEGVVAGRIVEAEAYRGPEDRAAHSFGGRRTARTEAMWGPAGFAYVFLVYGLHYQLNVVTTGPGAPHAVLLRALEPLAGAELMALRRGVAASHSNLSNGPGKLCQALGVDLRHYGADFTTGDLFLTEGARGKIERSARVGIDYAGDWAKKPWRFSEQGNRYVSRGKSRAT